MSQRIVIDACVAQSAGGDEASASRAKNCRDVLQAILDICHKVVWSDPIRAEWNTHQSRFARRFRQSMAARRKWSPVAIAPDEDLRRKVMATAANDRDRAAMDKDFPLIQAAMASDGIIVSADDRARSLFSAAAQQVGEIRQIMWVSPDDVVAILEWLDDGAPRNAAFELG